MFSTLLIVLAIIAGALLAIPLATGLLLALCGLFAVACRVLPILFVGGVFAGFYGLTGRFRLADDVLGATWDEVFAHGDDEDWVRGR